MTLPFILGMTFFGIAGLTWALMKLGTTLAARYRDNFTNTAQTNLQQMFMFVDTRKVFTFNLLAIFVVPLLVYLATNKIILAVVVGIFVLLLPKMVYRYMHARRLQRFDQQLPDSLNMIAGAMRAGASLPTAIEGMVRETEGPISQEFSLVLREQRLGKSLDEAFENLGARLPSQDLSLVVAAARIARDVGGSLSEIFDRLADTLRQKAIMEGKIKALTSQGKLQGWVVGLLPIGIMAVLFQMEPSAMGALFTSVAGWVVIAIIIILELMGAVFIKKIVTIDI